MAERDGNSGGGLLGTTQGIALDPTIASAWTKVWKQKTGQQAAQIALMLPSGTPIRAMRMPLRHLLKHGNIPDPLTPTVRGYIEALEGGGAKRAQELMVEQWTAEPEQTFATWLSILQTVWIACVTQPTFTDEDGDVDEERQVYPVSVVDYLDLIYVYEWAQGVDKSAAAFLDEQAETMGRLASGEGVSLSAEPTLRIERRDGRLVGTIHRPGDVAVGVDDRRPDGGDEGTGRPEAVGSGEDASPEAGRAVADAGDLRPAGKVRGRRGGRAA